MQILLNGEPFDTGAKTLAELCMHLGYGDVKIATAVNGDFVPEQSRSKVQLTARDKIEIVTPRQGG